MTEKEYNEHSGVRRSDLFKISESPEKYKWAITHPTEPTPALIFGAACHKYILEPNEWSDEYAIAPNVDRRTKAGKEEYERFCAENEGKAVVSQDQFDTMAAMANALDRCPMAEQLIHGKNGETEIPFFWTDKDTQEECKVKLDRLVEIEGRYVVVDYKTSQSAQTDKFVHSMIKFGYTLQAAMYTEGVMVCKELDYRPDFIFVVQEKDEPYSTNVIYVSSDSSVMQYGVDQFREYIGTLHQCKELDNWYGYLGPYGETSEAYLPGYIQIGEDE